MNEEGLTRFLTAHQGNYARALAEITHGKKLSHWMWYIFPQIAGLGFSETSKFYALKDRAEAEAYLQDKVLGKNLVEISEAALRLDNDNANSIFGSPDDLKLKSCITLFAALPDTNPVFEKLLAKFFNGVPDQATLDLIKAE